MMRAVRGAILLLLTFCFGVRCGPPPPAPSAAPATPAPPRSVAEEQTATGTVYVNASALNVRAGRSTDAPVLTQVRRGTRLTVLSEDGGWTRVRLASGDTGWVASRFVSRDRVTSGTSARSRGSCPPDSDYAFVDTPTLAFSDSGAHGLVVVEANVNASGTVSATRVVSNTTRDESLARLAEREIRSAKFSPPIRNCAPRAFVFTYRRTF